MSYPVNVFTNLLALASVLSPDDQLETRLDVNGSNQIVYVGKNLTPSASTSDSTWYIKKLSYDGSGNLIYVQLPVNGPGFLYSWDNRATYF